MIKRIPLEVEVEMCDLCERDIPQYGFAGEQVVDHVGGITFCNIVCEHYHMFPTVRDYISNMKKESPVLEASKDV